MKLESKSFQEGGKIPPEFTCDGKNISPQLSWKDFPENTKSFALSIVDPDAPSGNFIHWLVCDIPKDITEIEEGKIPEGAKQVENDFGRKQYGGPCPPSGTHRYVFTLCALDTENLGNVNMSNFFEATKQHRLAEAKLTGLYKRK